MQFLHIPFKGDDRMNDDTKENLKIFGIISGVILVLSVIIFLVVSIYIVEYNEYAYEKEFGLIKGEMKETGFNYVGLGSLIRINNQVRNYEIVVDSASKDLQDVKMILNLNIRIKKDKVKDFILNYKDEETYKSYLDNKIQEKTKVIVLKYNAEEFLNNRENIRKELLTEVNNIPELNYFTINDLAVKNIEFSQAFSNIIEQRARVEIERDTILRQKHNMELIKENLNIVSSKDYLNYKVAEKWNGESTLAIVNMGN